MAVGIVASIASLLVGSAIISQLSHLGAEPLELSSNIKKIADGKLSIKIENNNSREGSIVKEINKMSSRLKDVIHDVNKVSSDLNSTAIHMLDSSEKSKKDLLKQQQQTEKKIFHHTHTTSHINHHLVVCGK